jgi:hypothetical protein
MAEVVKPDLPSAGLQNVQERFFELLDLRFHPHSCAPMRVKHRNVHAAGLSLPPSQEVFAVFAFRRLADVLLNGIDELGLGATTRLAVGTRGSLKCRFKNQLLWRRAIHMDAFTRRRLTALGPYTG